mgnify:CR=1 FL=1
MSILGVIVRARPEHRVDVERQLAEMAGVDVAAASDGRWVLVIEDHAADSAAATMARITALPQVLNTSLVYEHSDPDAPAADPAVSNFQAWRETPGQTRNPT